MTPKKKKQYIRKQLRKRGLLPNYGELLTEEQQQIWDQIDNGDYTYYENILEVEDKERKKNLINSVLENRNKNTPNRRYYIRKKLRKEGYLPKYGEPMNEEQQQIWDQIDNGDFTFYNENITSRWGVLSDFNDVFICKECGCEDPRDFYKSSRFRCKSCILKERKEKYLNGDLNDSVKKNKKWQEKNILRVRFNGAKHRALRKGWKFELTMDMLLDKLKKQKGKCYITHTEMSLKPNNIRTLSIDRLDHTKGYTEENTVLVTYFVNTSKSTLSREEFISEIISCYEGIKSHNF